MTQPGWVLFDLNGTLLDPGPALPALEKAITLSMAETLSGGYRDFSELLALSLEQAGVDEPSPKAFADVVPALDALAAGAMRLGVLTNSSTGSALEKLDAVGLADRFEVVVGTDEVRAFKPDPRVYRRGLEQTGADASEACLVAAHGWDLLGAARAGMRTGFVERHDPAPAPAAPDWSAADLGTLTRAILASPPA